MKKTILIILIALVLILIIIAINISNNQIKLNEVSTYNAQFESYKEKNIYGADVLTIINKAIDNNKTYEVQKDKDGNYIEDDMYSLKVDLVLLTKNEKGEQIEVTYPMETLEKAGLDKFIESFSLTTFKCEEIEYNSIERVSKITVKQLEI